MEKFPFLSEVFDSINEGIYILNRQGDYIYCNSAFLKMVGATRDDVLELNAFRLVPEGQVSISVAVMAFEQKKKLSVVNNVCTPKGYHYRQLATATPIFDSVGEIEYMLVEMLRLDLFKKRYQQAILDEDLDCIEVPGLGDSVGDRPETFVAESQSMRALLDMAKQVAGVDSTILISGETGTGKEVLANFIHRHSHRADRPMVEINCAALPENLLEAELFGYEKGAFTGALNTGKPGMVEEANGGTLFLDEIGELPAHIQSKLLQLIQEKTIERLSGTQKIELDFRLIVATNRNLEEAVQRGLFRSDLFYRLNVIRIHIPPLRQRKEDIVPMAHQFLARFCGEYNKPLTCSPRFLAFLEQYDWPGNVRELRNVLEFSAYLSSSGIITEESLPDSLPHDPQSAPLLTLAQRTRAFEKREISRLLEQNGSSLEGKKKTAAQLGISLASLYNKLKASEI